MVLRAADMRYADLLEEKGYTIDLASYEPRSSIFMVQINGVASRFDVGKLVFLDKEIAMDQDSKILLARHLRNLQQMDAIDRA